MHKTIWKFPLSMYDNTFINMPVGSEILCVQTQNNEPHIWAIVEDDTVYEPRVFHIRGTGQPFNGMEGRYVGTFQTFEGQLVFHVFEDINVEYEEGNEFHTRRV